MASYYPDNQAMICPYCRVTFADNGANVHTVGHEGDIYHVIFYRQCHSCQKVIVQLSSANGVVETGNNQVTPGARIAYETAVLVKPKVSNRPSCPSEIPRNIAEDYNEACLVLADSPKASAALSRRCLQNILRDAAQVKSGDLYKEIDEAIAQKQLPTHLAETLDDVRRIGNFAAHPSKSISTGDIVPVEPHEAEWNLEVLEGLFDFYYVAPAKTKRRQQLLAQKLADIKKN